MLIRSEFGNYIHRVFASRASLFWPGLGLCLPRYHNVLVVREGPGGRTLFPAANLVTNDGDRFYARLIANEAPSPALNSLYLSPVAWDAGHPQKATTSENLASVIAGGEKAVSTGYPQTADEDADNPDAGLNVVTWQFNYAKGDFSNPGIQSGAIAAAGIAVPAWGAAPAQPILTGFTIAPAINKTANDTLKLIVNHTMTGV